MEKEISDYEKGRLEVLNNVVSLIESLRDAATSVSKSETNLAVQLSLQNLLNLITAQRVTTPVFDEYDYEHDPSRLSEEDQKILNTAFEENDTVTYKISKDNKLIDLVGMNIDELKNIAG